MNEVREQIAKLYIARWSAGCKDTNMMEKVYKDGLEFADQI